MGPLLLAAGAGTVIGGVSAWAGYKAQQAEIKYKKKLKAAQDKAAMSDLRKAGHDALLAKESLRVQTQRGKAEAKRQVANAVSEAIVMQAMSGGVVGNTADRITNSIYAAEGDMVTSMDLERRAEDDSINEQLDALTTATERQLAGGQIVDFSTKLGTTLSVATSMLGGATQGIQLYQGITSANP